ncbi:MAG: hypothetical protein ACFFGZ_01185 [Candidatus Thorarchaeota archaeon]
MSGGFCSICGTVLLIRRTTSERKKTEIYCPKCEVTLDSDSKNHKDAFLKENRINHGKHEETIILDDKTPPPIPNVMNVTKLRRRRCQHRNAVFQGTYQFGRGDEPSRNYWHCPDCGSMFRFGGRFRDLGAELSKNRKRSIQQKPRKGNAKP